MKSGSPVEAKPSYLEMLADAVRRARLARGFTQESLAHHLGMSRSHVSSLERGQDATLATLMKVLQGLEIDPAEFMSGIRLHVGEADALPHRSRRRISPPVSQASSYKKMLGEAVLHERERAGILQEELAHEGHFSRGYISNIERGIGNPRFTILMRILEHLAVQPADFFRHFRLLPNEHHEPTPQSIAAKRRERAARWAAQRSRK